MPIPAIKDWLLELKPPKREQAEKLIDNIGKLDIDEPDDRKLFFKYGALAFENLLYKQSLDQLDKISAENLQVFVEILGDFDDFEATLYYQIIQERLRIIDALRNKVEDNSVEKTIQKFLYEHLWLLDPSPRASASFRRRFHSVTLAISPRFSLSSALSSAFSYAFSYAFNFAFNFGSFYPLLTSCLNKV